MLYQHKNYFKKNTLVLLNAKVYEKYRWKFIIKHLCLLAIFFGFSQVDIQAQVSGTFVPNTAASSCNGDNTATLCYNLVGTGADGDGNINSINLILNTTAMSPDLVVSSWGDDDTGDALGGTYSTTNSPLGNTILNYADAAGRSDGAVLGTVCFCIL